MLGYLGITLVLSAMYLWYALWFGKPEETVVEGKRELLEQDEEYLARRARLRQILNGKG